MTENRKTALVTGASSGMGRETAKKLAKNNFQVIAVARRIDRLNELADQVEGIIPKQVDLSEPESVEKFCQYILNLTEPVSVLINNAGYSIRGTLEDVSIENIRRLYEVNLFSLIRVTQACLPGMRKQRNGIIVSLSSIVGKFTFPMSGVYASTKHAIEAINDSLRMDLRPLGIKVITVRPGPIATEFNEVGNKLSGDVLARTDPDYNPIYQASGAATGKLFAGVSVPGPELIADIIIEAVTSDSPKPVYSAGPFTEDLLDQRFKLDDESFDSFMNEKFGLKGLQV